MILDEIERVAGALFISARSLRLRPQDYSILCPEAFPGGSYSEVKKAPRLETLVKYGLCEEGHMCEYHPH